MKRMKFLFSLFGAIMLLSPICTYGQTTKVGDINNIEINGKQTMFDLSGRQIVIDKDAPLSILPKGMYIINHKKFIVK